MTAKTVLVADDSKTSQLLHTAILRRAGYLVTLARDGVEAVARATTEKPTLLLLDLVMPRMDGLQALQELRSRAATRELPVIVVTTRGEPGSLDAALQAGCSDYVTKPVDSRELLAKVRRFIGDP